MRSCLQHVVSCAVLAACGLSVSDPCEGKPPNIVFILADDQGIGDVSCYHQSPLAPSAGNGIRTPHIDAIAAAGIRFDSFYVHNRCSPSRAAFLTGCYADRVGINKVVYRKDRMGLNVDETTVAECLQGVGYQTALIGKWHLGEWPEFHPNRHGFQAFFGFLEYESRTFGLFRNQQLIEPQVSKTDGRFSPQLLQQALQFLQQNQQQPFFLYYASPLPHTKWKPMDRFRGSSSQGTYGDVVEELDWQVGEILAELKRLQLTDNTLVVYASDNGPQLNVAGHGSAGTLRDGKWSNFEGGIRVPCVMQWPGHIPAGTTCEDITGIIDMLPTFCELAGAKLPDLPLDGRSLVPCLHGQSPAEPVHQHWIVPGKTIRSGEWKLFTTTGKPGGVRPDERETSPRRPVSAGTLFHLTTDLAETTDQSAGQQQKVTELQSLMKQFLRDFQVRPAGSL